jgi:arylamine N-acetyltransferase
MLPMVLRIDLPEGPFLAGVGFGNMAPTTALKLVPLVEQETPREPMRFPMATSSRCNAARRPVGAVPIAWRTLYRALNKVSRVRCGPGRAAIMLLR